MGKTEEEIKKEKRRKYLNEKIKSYERYCGVCKNGKNYTLRGKAMHLKTKKRERNHNENKPLFVF